MKFGFSDKSLMITKATLHMFPEIERCAVFGSRAMGHHRNGSDVDLVVYGKQITDKTLIRLGAMLNEELPLPYFFDIVHYDTLENFELIEHIDERSVLFYPGSP